MAANTVESVIKTPFSQRLIEKKLAIRREGKATPTPNTTTSDHGVKQKIQNGKRMVSDYPPRATVDMFVRKAIEKVLDEREIKKSQHAQLRKACEVALSELDNENPDENAGILEKTSGVVPDQFIEADKYFLPFELACQSKSSKIVVISLDCIQKLIAYGHLTGKSQDSEDPSRKLIDRIVNAICGCFSGPQTDDTVQLQIVKALLTVVTSTACEVHEGSLLNAVKTTFNIYLASKNVVNQMTAKASLTQMLNLVWSRMEAVSAELANSAENNEAINIPTSYGDTDSSDSQAVRGVVEYMITRIEMELGVADRMSDYKDSLPKLGPSQEGDLHAEGVVNPKSNVPSSKGTNQVDSAETSPQHQISAFAHVRQKDCYLLFRALCKLSMKGIPESADQKSHEYKSKILSLQLLLSVLQDPGPVFQSHPVFILAIKQYLCVSLSRNGVSSILEIFELSLAIFLSLLRHFKAHLKMQIEVFFREIFLNILETASSSFEQKWMVMQALSKICSDAQCVVDIYINYDCDLSAANIFERLVLDIEKVAQGRQAAELGAAPGQDRAIRLKGLQCLVDILKCMVEWSKDLYVSPANMAGDSQQPQVDETKELENALATSLFSEQSDSETNQKGAGIPESSSVYTFEQLKMQKEVMEKGIEMFNRKPASGVRFLQERGLVGQDPPKIAEFIHKEERLDKAVVGDFLGDGDAYCKEIMYAYLDQMDFGNMAFLQALRTFLEGFRLPGEAQKIDRLMEKFASRFCENNPDHKPHFASADTAYVLAYSVIMLTTDLHSAQVKNKMTKAQYIKMNRGINDSEDLPEWYLSEIYDQIAVEEIKMKAHASQAKLQGSKSGVTQTATEKQRRLLYNFEMEQMSQTAKALMEAAYHVPTFFTAATHSEHVRPMFKLAWRPCIAAFSIGLQDTHDDSEIWPQCLEGFRCAIRIACIFHSELERDAFLQALARFTLLTANSALTEMRVKNVDTIKTLILVAHTDGNYLGCSWLEILRCISQLELAQLIGTGVNQKFLQGPSPGAKNGPNHNPPNRSGNNENPEGGIFHGLMPGLGGAAAAQNKGVQESLGETSSQSVIVAVDRIFTGSIALDGNAIVEFVKALCQVSHEELSNPAHPRMFSLQKIVEISYYNMGRIRLQWSRVWEVLGPYFNEAGCNRNEVVASFAVDSLRQLSMKFLERGELPNFRFQKDFLRPFEYIMKHNESEQIHDIIVTSMANMCNLQAKKIKSGWKNVFAIFQMAAGDPDQRIVELAFRTTQQIMKTVFVDSLPTVIDSFQEAVKTLSEFACNPSNPDMSMESIDLIRKCANIVASNAQLFAEHAWDDSGSAVHESERIWMRGWFPIIFEMSCIVVRCKLDVRTRALSEMFVIMKTYGEDFQADWWRELFKVSCRIFDVMKLPEQQTEKAEWLMTTCNHALLSIVDVFSHYYTKLQDVVLQDLYDLICGCVKQENEQLAKSGVECLGTLITSNGLKFTPEIWNSTIKLILSIFEDTIPYELLTWSPSEAGGATKVELGHPAHPPGSLFVRLQVKCIVQLELINTVDLILFGGGTSRRDDERNFAEARGRERKEDISPEEHSVGATGLFSYLKAEQLMSLATSLVRSYKFAKEFNCNQNQRNLLWKVGFFGKDKPNLHSQERTSLMAALRLLFRLYQHPPQDISGRGGPSSLVTNCDYVPQVSTRRISEDDVRRELNDVCSDALQYFMSLKSEQHRAFWVPVVLLILCRIVNLPLEQYREQAFAHHSALAGLIAMDLGPELRFMLGKFFSKLPLAPLQS